MKALIVGAGVAGPVTAMALQQIGIEAVIFESHPPSDGEVGSYFTLTANGLEALAAIGARDLATAAGFPTRRNVMWNETGRRLAALPLDSSVPGSPAAHTMKRSRLARVLQDETIRRGIRIDHGRRLSRAEVAADGRVLATFDDGSVVSGDLLIGADGVHSVVRLAIDPAAPSGRYIGLTNFGGVTRGAAEGIQPEEWNLIFGRHAFFGYQATPDGDVVWFANVPRPLITLDERASTTEDAWRRQLAGLFAGDAGPAVELIETGELELAADNTHDLGHVPAWHRGPMIVIGDAAHAPAPTSGQGASMAIEDAIALAAELGRTSSIDSAFAAYEQRRRDRVEKIVAWGARGSSNKVPGRFGRFARDAMLRILFRWVITEKSLGWMYDYRIGLATPLRTAAASARG
jgi:2-polyprenyl-6-methoxyphenol hydroxylase-like FAD-dependent oxidoreductase